MTAIHEYPMSDGVPIAVLPFCATQVFRMTCSADQVCLCLSDAQGRRIGMFQMERLGEGPQWELSLRLRPDSYRYRYYAQDGRRTIYVRPSDVDDFPQRMDGFDAIILVKDERQTRVGDDSLCFVEGVPLFNFVGLQKLATASHGGPS